MNAETAAHHPDDTPERLALPTGMLLWLMIGLAALGLAIAVYLAATHVLAVRGAEQIDVPLCGGLRGLDCNSVLNSRYATLAGVPVAFGGVAAHAVTLIGLLLIGFVKSRSSRAPRAGGDVLTVLLRGTAGAVIGAAAWFTYVQWQELGVWCAWCMFEHLVGVMLSALVLIMVVPARGRGRRAASWALTLAAIGALVGGQLLANPGYARPITWQADDEQWAEPIGDGEPVRLMGGRAWVDPSAHPMLGRADAKHVIVEVIDYTCGRCARFAPTLSRSIESLGPDYAVLIVLAPTDAACNPHIENTPAHAAGACDYARLASAVWLAEPAQFVRYHGWLMAGQDSLNPKAARAEAARIVGGDRLARTLADDRVDQLIQRDIAFARWLKVRSMPGLIVGGARFSALPEDAATLSMLIRRALEAEADAAQPAAQPASRPAPRPAP